jgi:hypothetical protein
MAAYPKSCANAQKHWRVWKTRAILYLEAQESPGAPHNGNNEKKKEKI